MRRNVVKHMGCLRGYTDFLEWRECISLYGESCCGRGG